MYTIDASVYVNASDPREDGQAISEQFLQSLRTHHTRVVEPTLVITEVAAAIGRGRGDATLAQRLAQQLSQLPNTTFMDLTVPAALTSATIAANHRLRGADAVYAAVALNAQTTLVTLDQEQIKRLQGVVPVCSPTEALSDLEAAGGMEP